MRSFIFICIAAFLSLTVAPLRAQDPNSPAAQSDRVTLKEKLARMDRPLVWVITGDSITQGAKWLGHERGYPEIVQERVRWSLNRRRDLIINSGVSGEKTGGLLADFDWRVLHFHPDIVSIMIGMNNAAAGLAGRPAFETDLREMIRLIRTAGAIPVLHRTNPIDDENAGAKTRSDLPAYNEVIARVAQSTQTILVDHWTHWRKAKPTPAALRDWLADPIHPNAAGHRQMAIEFFKAIDCYDATSPTCQP